MSFTARLSHAPTVPISLVVALVTAALLLPPWPARAELPPPDHLVISELVTGGSSASDELIELYNPTAADLPLEGLELVYVSSSGATVSRRAAWAAGAPVVPPGHHVLVANELGVYADIADATFSTGMAATGGSVALRIQGASSAIDALGWGTAASSWMEGTAAVAPPAGSSLERLPGGSAGSGDDADDNASDFTLREVPDPQNLGSPPAPGPAGTPGPTATPAASASAAPTATATATATALPTPAPTPAVTPAPGEVITVAAARALADGAEATIEATATTASDFSDGGGYVADETAGIAVIVDGGGFARGERLRLTGELSDRFAQRTLRVAADGVVQLGNGTQPDAVVTATGAVGEGVEGRLVRVTGQVAGAPTALSAGLAYDVDDGSGTVRVLVASSTGIDTGTWERGASVTVAGVVGQRDSSGTGALGYRVQPRDPADVAGVAPPASPGPSGSTSPSASPSPSGSAGPSGSATPVPSDVISIAEARQAPKNTRVRVRGVVTLPTGVVDPQTAVVQDGSGAIVLRIGEEVGQLSRGSHLEVDGTRSTKGGMETLRVTVPPRRLGTGSEPTVRSVSSGSVGEEHEALLVTVRGALVAGARTSSTGTVTFDLDDGSGPLRVTIGSAIGYDDTALVAGTWVEVRGVVGQETTGAQPSRGYRIWPRDAADIRVLASPAAGGAVGEGGAEDGAPVGDPAGGDTITVGDLGGIPDGSSASGARIGATLVAGPWPEIGAGGLLWDGIRLVALEQAASDRVTALLGPSAPPMPVELSGLRTTAARIAGVAVAQLSDAGDGIARGEGATHPPATTLPGPSDPPRWVTIVGRLIGRDDGLRLVVESRATIRVESACAEAPSRRDGMVAVTGLATPDRAGTVVVGCTGFMYAPTLDRRTDATATGSDQEEARYASTAAPVTEAPPASSAVPAALLAMAAMALVAGAVAARRFADDRPPEDEPTGQAADGEPTLTSPPALTLVTLPRERSP